MNSYGYVLLDFHDKCFPRFHDVSWSVWSVTSYDVSRLTPPPPQFSVFRRLRDESPLLLRLARVPRAMAPIWEVVGGVDKGGLEKKTRRWALDLVFWRIG